MSKIHWLNSLPSKYKDEILDQVVTSGNQLDEAGNYKIVLDLLNDNKNTTIP